MSLRIAGGAFYFNPLVSGVLQGAMKFGSSQSCTLTVSPTKIASYNNDDTGIGLKDADVLVRKDYAGTVVVRNVPLEMIGLAFGANAVTARAQSSGTLTETLTDVKQGRYYQLGKSASFPTGARMLSSETVEVSSVAKTGYTIDLDQCLIYIVPGGDIADGDDVDVGGSLAAANWETVISSDAEITGEAFVKGTAATGDPVDHFMPKAVLTLDGDYQIKGDPENPAFADLTFAISALEDTENGLSAVYIDGRPA